MNSGISASAPLKSIADALSRIYADSLNPHTIHIANGLYGENETGEANIIQPKEYVSLVGESESGVIIFDVQIRINQINGVSLENMILENSAIDIYQCNPTLKHMTIRANTGGYGLERKSMVSHTLFNQKVVSRGYQASEELLHELTTSKKNSDVIAACPGGPGIVLLNLMHILRMSE